MVLHSNGESWFRHIPQQGFRNPWIRDEGQGVGDGRNGASPPQTDGDEEGVTRSRNTCPGSLQCAIEGFSLPAHPGSTHPLRLDAEKTKQWAGLYTSLL